MNNKHKIVAAVAFGLSLAACTQTTPMQSGGSGVDEDRMLGVAGPANSCLVEDTNCRFIYNSQGGGD